MRWVQVAVVSVVIGLLFGWEVICRMGVVPPFILPPPSRILETTVMESPRLLPHAGVTLMEIVAGIAVAIGVAVPLAIVMFYNPAVERALAPILIASQAVPVFAVAPLLVIWLGYGIASKVFMASVIIFFPLPLASSKDSKPATRTTGFCSGSWGPPTGRQCGCSYGPGHCPSSSPGSKWGFPWPLSAR